jgi:triosephosphate isomerase
MNRKYRGVVIAANWKMNKPPSLVKTYAETLKSLVGQARWCEIVVCPSFVSISGAIKAFRGCRVSIGAQDVSAFDIGAYTGEVSARDLSEIGARYVIVGHSERRARYGEDDLTVGKKVRAALTANLRPIVCVGESLLQRETGVTADVVTLQVKTALHGVPDAQVRRVIIAYEPIWAIGTGKTATAKDAGDVAGHIRAIIRKLYGARVARAVPILYGGSMNGENARELLLQPDIDGGLIGPASLAPEPFAGIVLAARPDNT